MSKYILIFCTLILLSSQAAAQGGGKIVGNITDASTGQPLVGCSVFIENLMLGDATDEDGNFLILNVPSGTHNRKG